MNRISAGIEKRKRGASELKEDRGKINTQNLNLNYNQQQLQPNLKNQQNQQIMGTSQYHISNKATNQNNQTSNHSSHPDGGQSINFQGSTQDGSNTFQNSTVGQQLLNQIPTYRIAKPARHLQNMSEQFWDEANKNNKGILKVHQTVMGRQQSALIPSMHRTASQPRIRNDQQPDFENEESMENDFNNEEQLENAIAKLNSKTNFQRNISIQSQPYSFLSSVGGQQAQIGEIETRKKGFSATTGGLKQDKSNQSLGHGSTIQFRELSAQQTMEKFKQLDMDMCLQNQQNLIVQQESLPSHQRPQTGFLHLQSAKPPTIPTKDVTQVASSSNATNVMSNTQQEKFPSLKDDKTRAGLKSAGALRINSAVPTNSQGQILTGQRFGAKVNTPQSASQLPNQVNNQVNLDSSASLQSNNYRLSQGLGETNQAGSRSPQHQNSQISAILPSQTKSAKNAQAQLTQINYNRPTTANPSSGTLMGSGAEQPPSGASFRLKSGMVRVNSSKLNTNTITIDNENTIQRDRELGIMEDFDGDDYFYENADQIHGMPSSTRGAGGTKSALQGQRPLSGNSVGPEHFFQNFTQYTNFNALQFPYEDLFDRNERTIGATFAQFGDLGYYSPVQRIGSYMQYGAKLKLHHLLQIVNLQQTITNTERPEFEIPIQLAILDELNPILLRSKTGVSTTFHPEDLQREPVSLSLYPEYFYDASNEELSSAELAERYFYKMFEEMGGVTYDPQYLGQSNYIYMDPSTWPDYIRNQVESSIARYMHYLNTDIIRPDEIPKFKQYWMTNAFNKVSEVLLRNEGLSRKIFQEIFENFKESMKRVLLNYVLMCPEERQRLHIELLPREVLCSAQRIAREGGYNLVLFSGWHQFVEKGQQFCKNNLFHMNIIHSAVLDWTEDFKDFRLMEFETFQLISALGCSMSISNFFSMQNINQSNVHSIMKNIWLRGCVLIIKNFQFLRRVEQRPGKWRFTGHRDNRSIKLLDQAKIQIQNAFRNVYFTQAGRKKTKKNSYSNLIDEDHEQYIMEEQSKEYEESYADSRDGRIKEQDEEDEEGGYNEYESRSYNEEITSETQRKLSLKVLRHVIEEVQEQMLQQENRVTEDGITGVTSGGQRKQEKDTTLSLKVYQAMLKYCIERDDDITLGVAMPNGMRKEDSSHQPTTFDFYDDVSFRDLQDIREIYAYKNKPTQSMEEQSISQDQNPWSYYTKEFKQKILKNVGVLMGIQLRSLVEKTIQDTSDFFLGFRTYRQWLRQERGMNTLGEDVDGEYIDQSSSIRQNPHSGFSEAASMNTSQNLDVSKNQAPSRGSVHGTAYQPNNTNKSKLKSITNMSQAEIPAQNVSLLNIFKKDQEIKLREPDFLQYSKEFNPIFHILIIYRDESLQLNERPEDIKQIVHDFLSNNIVNVFQDMLHPCVSKININDMGKKEDQDDYGYRPDPEDKFGGKRRHALSHLGDTVGSIQDQFEDFYRHFCQFVSLKEQFPKDELGGLDDGKDPRSTKANQQGFQSNIGTTGKEFLAQIAAHVTTYTRLQVADSGEAVFSNSISQIVHHILRHYDDCHMVFEVFEQFKPFIERTAERELKSVWMKKGNITNDEFRNYLDVLSKFKKLLEKIPDHVYLPLFDVDCTAIKAHLERELDLYRNNIIASVEDSILATFRTVSETYVKHSSYLTQSLLTADDVEKMERFVTDLTSDMIQLKLQGSQAFLRLMFMLKLDLTLGPFTLNLAKEVYDWPSQMEHEITRAEEKHAKEREDLERNLADKIRTFQNRVQVYEEELQDLEMFTQYTRYKENIQSLEAFETLKLSKTQDLLEDIVDQQKQLFGYVSDFSRFEKLVDRFQPFLKLWTAVGNFVDNQQQWQNGPVVDLNFTDFESTVKENMKISNRLISAFDGSSIAFRIVNEFREDIETVNKNAQLVQIISRPGLRERHWNEIQQTLNQSFNFKELKLRELTMMNVQEKLDIIEQITENATKEYTLESDLEKMEREWESLSFIILSWKNRGVKILQGSQVEDIQILLDDHAIRAQNISANQSVQFMEGRAQRWEQLMLYIQDVLEIWIKVQGLFLYLEPIFAFEDINKTLVTESEQFQKVSSAWTRIMQYIEEDPKVLSIENIPNLKDDLDNSLRLIEEIQQGLEDHLQVQRLEFPRFFFLSNQDLLTILAQTRDPTLVQPHMKKCFEGINQLIFNSNVDITGMRSSEKEEIMFLERICPRNFQSNVEKWLIMVEEQMRLSIAQVIEDSLLDYQSAPQKRSDWVRRWPGQVILTLSSLTWTQNFEEKIKKDGVEGVSNFYNTLVKNLESIVTLVRGNLSALEMITLGALIVIDLHNKDTTKDLLDAGIDDINSFKWLSQMRYYWQSSSARVLVKMMTTTQQYGYEYLGNTGRLVITPLTDRCYRTLMSALQLNLGGAPQGPAGTGKTETTQDLAKALAMQCVVFNCSEGLNILSMAQFFKGLISAGAWSCFDEFNRIDLEVLSVIAQQILQIQQAKAAGQTRMLFQNTDIPVLPNCNVFITMNPGYAGRSELPDNLKALFRPVAMMVPDYGLIAQISLYSFGFVDARNQARKIVNVYKLCSEQLSSQDHYDYGMRAVKAVLTTASMLKRKFPSEKEEILILRSICDVNIPQFLTQDIQLFMGITSDLFPGCKLQAPEYTLLNLAITSVMNSQNLQNINSFRKKIFQLYEVINTRHGMMLVGQPFSGKTTCYRVLAAALTLACQNNGGATDQVMPVHYHVLNPKSISINQMYGFTDLISKEWTEGILAEIYRQCATDLRSDRQFIVFDGPVDADWIENLNTVLDDNKKLCLMNGETIAMTPYMTMMFEVGDLKQASPATVSRCGMVYLSPDQLGWWPIVLSWSTQTFAGIDSVIPRHVEELFDALMEQCIRYVKSKGVEFQQVAETALVVACMRMMQNMLLELQILDSDLSNMLNKKPEEDLGKIDMIFLFCLVWSVGSTIDEPGRKNFDNFLKKLVKDPVRCDNRQDKLIQFEKGGAMPDNGKISVYQYYVTPEFKWRLFRDVIEANDAVSITPSGSEYHQIVIETLDMLRATILLEKAVKSPYPFLIVGPTGTGKSTLINKYLKSLPGEQYLIVFVNFSAQSTPEQTQDIIDSKLDRRRKGIYGPKFGMQCILFIEDVNMPAYDQYGAQPPIELLRQFLDSKGWYGKDRKFMEIIDTSIVGAMGPPGGGRNLVTSRFIRHFTNVAICQSDTAQMIRIFSKLMDWHLFTNNIPSALQGTYKNSVEATVQLYQLVIENLKPTPAKSHYLFNLRDISRVMQGMMLIVGKDLKDSTVNTPNQIVRLWINQSSRVFFDRLSFESDQTWFYNTLVNVVRSKMKEEIKTVMKGPHDIFKLNMASVEVIQAIRFSEIMGEPNTDQKYEEITDLQKLNLKAEFYLEDYNMNTKRPMNLVLFEFAIDHALRIARMLRMAQGHGLLIGLGGSGRMSMTSLASHIRDLPIFQIEVSQNYQRENWQDDMIGLLTTVGVDRKEITFAINDATLQKSFILQDVNNLLDCGDIPNLFSQEDFIPLLDRLRNSAKREGRTDLLESGTTAQFYDFFKETIKKKLHIVLMQSPVGDTLRNRIRMFPNIVNCTTIVWYKEWPEEALQAVANQIISEMYLQNSLIGKLVPMCKAMHMSAINLSASYQKNEGRFNYITPSSYLELLNNLRLLLSQTQQKLEDQQNIYTNGVMKLISTSEQVQNMEEELTDLKPLLIQANIDIAQLAEEIQIEVTQMEPMRLQAEQEEQEVNARVKQAEIIKQECEADLSVAKPKLKKAEDALDTLDSSEINIIKAMLKPPETVQLVMEAVCVINKIPPQRIPNPENPKERILSYWEASQKFLSTQDFLKGLKEFDQDNIDEAAMKKIRENYISKTAIFNPKRVKQASSAAMGLCEWILAMDEYEKVYRFVKPKILKHQEAKQEVNRLQKNLKKTREELAMLTGNIKRLEDRLEDLRKQQQIKQRQIDNCEKKLQRASSLIISLGGQMDRWKQTAARLEDQLLYVIGDVVMSTGVISYLGPFSGVYRARAIKEWHSVSRTNHILVSDNYSLEFTLGEPIQIRKWNLNGLPSDAFSRENGIIAYTTKRWPLFIDPQNQANRWIKQNQEAGGKVIVVKQNDNHFMRSLETSIQYGNVLIIQNCKQEFDAILDPVLSKQTFKNNGIVSIKLGDSILDYSQNFKCFLTSKLRNPHFTPEISTKVTLVNFTITKEGLEDQLLEICVIKERPDDEEKRVQLIVQSYENQNQLDDIQKKILQVLQNAENILQDEEGVNILQQSKVLSNEIEEKQKAAKETQERIEESRNSFRPIAKHCTTLFFATMDMAVQDFMYQYSLNWFLNIYSDSFDRSEQNRFVKQRVENINNYFTYSLYSNICRSLFEKDKLLFSLLLLIRILDNRKQIDHNELSFLITPISTSSGVEAAPQNKLQSWLPDQVWLQLYQLSKSTTKFKEVLENFAFNEKEWEQIYYSSEAFSSQFPAPYNAISHMQRLCLLKAFRPDKLIQAVTIFIREELGDRFTVPPPFNLQLSFSDSNPSTPLVFILPGTDPMLGLIAFSDSQNKQLKAISLGQGQGVHAERAIEEAQKFGGWVILQNCHLAPSWMGRLEQICEDLITNNSANSTKEKSHPGFRLWLTSYPSSDFPTSILQNSVQMTNQAPQGVRSNLKVSYLSDIILDPNFFENHSKQKEFKSLLFGLCFFHAVIQQRRTFGPLGWNIQYDFNQSDLRISMRQVYLFLNEYAKIPFDALHYLIGECNYGGRVTDDKDRRTLLAIMKDFFSDKVLQENFTFSNLPEYKVPAIGDHSSYLKFIQDLPSIQPPSIFGFHQNAEIMREIQDTDELCTCLLLIMGGSGSSEGDQNYETKLKSICHDILTQLPGKFDPELVAAKYPLNYQNSMNTVLQQEIVRYNNLLSTIVSSLKEVENALKGTVVMSANLEKICNSLIKGLIPDFWKKVSYPSLQPLSSYIADFVMRLTYYSKWISSAQPRIHWISGYFFTQTFLTATLQNYARQYTIPIDNLTFQYEFFGEPPNNWEEMPNFYDITEGALMHGLYLEGCKWNYQSSQLNESDPQVLYVKSPIIWLKPTQNQNIVSHPHYQCPVYQTGERQGTLSTTGHSTNFIMYIQMPTSIPEDHWVKRGVAMICQLND